MSIPQTDLEKTLLRAREAQLEWAARPLSERLRPIQKLRSRLAREPFVLAEIVAKEIGKARFEAVASEVMPVADTCAFLLDRAPSVLAPRREPLRGLMPFAGSAVIRHLPWGIVAVLSPWNYPLFLCAAPALNALAAGNGVALKASPRAKETVLKFGEWLWDAGIPRELAPVLDTSDDMGRALVASPLIDRIVFTGGSRTGRAVLSAAAQNLTPATVELSGFDAAYILQDANPKLAAAAVTFGMRLNAGRTCICPRRLFVEAPIADAFFDQFKARLQTHKLLDPMDAQTLREADELAAKLSAISDVKPLLERRAGDPERAIAVIGGEEACAAAAGNFVPAIIATKVNDADEALSLTKKSRYALGASIFSSNKANAAEFAKKLGAGIIGINECVAYAGEAALPFGGTGESGYGVRGGDEGLLEMTRPQALAFPSSNFRPHHDAEAEAEDMIVSLLRARHSDSIFSRARSWIDFAIAGIKWRPPKR